MGTLQCATLKEVFFPRFQNKNPRLFRGYRCPRADNAGALGIALHNLAVAWQQEMAF